MFLFVFLVLIMFSLGGAGSLVCAPTYGHVDVVRLLLDEGADVYIFVLDLLNVC